MIETQNVAERAGIGRFIPNESAHYRSVIDPVSGWDAKLASLTGKVDRADTQANIARHRKWLTVMRFFIGEQLGFVDEAGAWQTITRNQGDPIYVVNFLQYFVNALLKDYVRSQAVLDVTARGGKMKMRLAARPASELLKIVQQDQNNPTAIERDGKFCILLGNTFRYTICTADTGKYRKEPVTEKVQLQLSGSSAICLECGQVSELDTMPDNAMQGMNVGQQQCPQCGSNDVEVVQGASAEYSKITGFENRSIPDVMTSIVDPFEVKLPIAAENEILAGWLRRERFVDLSKLRASYPWAELTETAQLHTGETPLLAQSQIQQSPGNVGGFVTAYNSTPQQQDLRRFQQYWYRPEEYADFTFTQDEQMANGEVIRAGTRAIELFPKGLYVAKCGQTVLEVAPEDKADCWVHNRWEVVPDAIWGYGIDHVIQAQEMNNEVYSLVYEHIMHNTTPPVVLDPRFLQRSDWSNKPGMVAVLRNPAPTGGAGQAFAVAQGRPVGGDTFGFLEMLKGDFQLLSGGAFSTSSGLPDVHTDTLGGMQIQRDQALAQHVSKLNRKAEADVKTGKQQLRVIKRHNLAQFYFPRLSDYSEYELQVFNECDVDLDLEIKARPQSWIPRSTLEQRGDLEAALMLGGLPLGVFNPEIPRAIKRLAFELLNLPSIGEQMAADERNTLLNIVHLLEFAQMAEELAKTPAPPEPGDIGYGEEPMMEEEFEPSGPTPEEALLMAANIAPVRYRVDDHPMCIETIIDFLKTDAGRHLSPLAELLLNDLITRHKQGMAMLMMEDAVNPLGMGGMQPNAVPPGTPQGSMPLPMPGAPQQQMSPQPLGGGQKPQQPKQSGQPKQMAKQTANPQGNKPTPMGP